MSKRSSFARRPRDLYDTPREAVLPLLPHLMPETHFVEPCAGNGKLVSHLEEHGHVCVQMGDIEPLAENVKALDATTKRWPMLGGVTAITNPPWSRDILHPLIVNLSDQMPTWLLFDAAWAYTTQAREYLPRLRRVVTVGRVKWIPGTTMTGKDDSCWYCFGHPMPFNQPQFFGK